MMRRPLPPKRYKKTNRLSAAGAHGTIEVWHDQVLNREVAIKWIGSNEGEEQLLNEYRFLADATSRHVVEIYDLIFDHHGVLYGIVMEYVDGNNLAYFKPPVTEIQFFSIVRILYQLALGLSDLHKKEIVHRDIKPENVMVSPSGRLKICDFGLSGPSGMLTQRVRATMGYCPPEFFSKPAVVTTKSDVYSYGVMCWKLFTGGLPFVGRLGFPDKAVFPLESIDAHQKMSPRLSRIINSCLAWSAEERPDISEVVVAMRNELTRGQHLGSVELSKGPVIMSANSPRKKLNAGDNSIEVVYDMYDFRVETVTGQVYINNSLAACGNILTEGCLLTFGGIDLGPERGFAPFRQFVPEIII